MDKEYWIKRWEEGRTGFNQERGCPYLLQRVGILRNPHHTIFVPLCGKTVDLVDLYFAAGFHVIGNELYEPAVTSFYLDRDISFWFKEHDNCSLKHFVSDGIDILQGDFFDIRKDCLPPIGAVFDRAALVAFPPQMREKYVQKLISLLPDTGVKILLVTLEFDQADKKEPPFPVSEQEVAALYGEQFSVSVAEEHYLKEESEAKQMDIVEKVYILSR